MGKNTKNQYNFFSKKKRMIIQFKGGATPESTETADTRTKTPLRPSSAEIGILSAKFSPEFTAEVIADS